MSATRLKVKTPEGFSSYVTVPEGTRAIVKYPNRRLYDTQDSRYITMRDVAALVRDRIPVRIVEKKTGKDLTRDLLLLTLREVDSDRVPPLLPEENILQLLRAS